MLILLSPAKKLDFQPPTLELPRSRPELSKHTQLLMETVRGLKAKDLKQLMKLSDSLAKLNYQRFQRFSVDGRGASESKQAALAFNGDTYVGLRAGEFDAGDFDFAQQHLRILSGLYGVLRPLDMIQPYRLEMGTQLRSPRGKSLYEFWGSEIAKAVDKQARKLGSKVVVNLASQEYFSALPSGRLKTPVLTPVFKEKRGDTLKQIGFSAKRARGMMARYIIKQRLTEPEALKGFKEAGYRFAPKLSSPPADSPAGGTQWVFVRAQ